MLFDLAIIKVGLLDRVVLSLKEYEPGPGVSLLASSN